MTTNPKRIDASARDAVVQAVIASQGGTVPPVRAMAATLGWSHGAVHTVYRRLGLRASRPDVPKRAYPRLHPALHPDDFDVLYREAEEQGLTITQFAERLHRRHAHYLRIRNARVLDHHGQS